MKCRSESGRSGFLLSRAGVRRIDVKQTMASRACLNDIKVITADPTPRRGDRCQSRAVTSSWPRLTCTGTIRLLCLFSKKKKRKVKFNKHLLIRYLNPEGLGLRRKEEWEPKLSRI